MNYFDYLMSNTISWVLERTVSVIRFFQASIIYVFTGDTKKNRVFNRLYNIGQRKKISVFWVTGLGTHFLNYSFFSRKKYNFMYLEKAFRLRLFKIHKVLFFFQKT